MVDELFDKQVSWSGSVTYVAGSLTRNGISAADSNLSGERSLDPPLLRFFGPLSVTSANPITYTYEKQYVCGANARTAAFAKIGDTTFGSEDYTFASASLVSSSTGGGNCTAQISSVTEKLDPLVRTDPATSVTTTGANVEGFIDPYGTPGSFYRFSYSADPNLISSVTSGTWVASNTSTPKPITQSLSGLNSGTTYYYRAELKSSAGSVFLGSVMSFTTLSIQAAPTAVTLPATSIAATSATLNGEIDPNLTAVTGVRFVYANNLAMTSATTTSFITIVDEGSTVQLTLAGDGTNEVSQGVTGLTSGTTYYFRVLVSCVADATYCPGGLITGNIQSFTAGAPTVTTEPATNIGGTSASISSIVTFGSNVSHKFIFCKEGGTFTGVISQVTETCSAANVADSPSSTSAVTLTSPSGALTTASLLGLDSGSRYFFVAVGASSANANLKSLGRVNTLTPLP